MISHGFLPKVMIYDSEGLPDAALNNTLPESSQAGSWMNLHDSEEAIQKAQEVIYSFFIELVNNDSSDSVLREFEKLFLQQSGTANFEACLALQTIISGRNEFEFRNLMKRCCYILLNNWVGQRNYPMNEKLIRLISEQEVSLYSLDSHRQQLKNWMANFVNSSDYEEIKLFVSKYANQDVTNWTDRYTSFLLVPQYVDEKNPLEQRQAAQRFSKQLKEQFKFDLALYTARVQSTRLKVDQAQNPSVLGDEVLLLIKNIVARRGSMSYVNLAKTFLNQTRNLTYKNFKQSLLLYLLYSEKETPLVKTLRTLLTRKVEKLYGNYDEEPINGSIILMICNKVIKLLTIEKVGVPSSLFNFLVEKGNPLTLAIMLLKLVLISPHSRTRLEICLALLIKHYEGKSPKKCEKFINFLELCKILLTIYAENVQYNLVKMDDNNRGDPKLVGLDRYRIFSQHKTPTKKEKTD